MDDAATEPALEQDWARRAAAAAAAGRLWPRRALHIHRRGGRALHTLCIIRCARRRVSEAVRN